MKINIFLFVLVLCFIGKVYSQDVNDENIIRPDYKIENKKSDLHYAPNKDIIKSIVTDEKFLSFFKKHKNEPKVYYSSLIKFKIKDKKLCFDKVSKKYEPNYLLSNLINKTININDFNNSKNNAVGIFYFYNAEDFTLFVELVEIKNKKYYLIYNGKTKVFDETPIPQGNCKPVKEKSKQLKIVPTF